jgi:hypothetical protein
MCEGQEGKVKYHRKNVLTLVIGVLTAETITTSSAELISNLALPKDGMAEVIL